MKTGSIIIGMMALMLLASTMVSKWTHPDIFILASVLGLGSLLTWSLGDGKLIQQRRLKLMKKLKDIKAKDIDPVKGVSSLHNDIVEKLAKEDLSQFDPNSQQSIIALARAFMKKNLGVSDKKFDELLKKSKKMNLSVA